MIKSHRVAKVLTPIALLFVLASCSTGGAEPVTSPESEAPGGGEPGDEGTEGLAGCAPGHSWSADVPDMATQLLAFFESSSSPVTEVVGAGSQQLDWAADGTAQISTEYTFTMTAPMGEGLVMTLKQTHDGPATGTLTLDGDTAVPSGWDNTGYTITNVVDINGQTSDELAFPLPPTELGAVPLTVTCDGDTMTTTAEGGLITQTWNRAD